VHILCSGVIITSIIKDLYSLPRPLSPPLYRITMSDSTALEYGFPSTHSANAVSMTVYGVLLLRTPELGAALGQTTTTVLEAIAYLYSATIVLGRIYCGMHGFLDIAVGSLVGAAIALTVYCWGPAVDVYMHQSSWLAPALAALLCVWVTWIHPEPADDCPCFDDSVAVLGVVIGIEIGTWTYGRIAADPWSGSAYGSTPPAVSSLPWTVLGARIVLGLAIVFGWRETAKAALLRGLPHLFRLLSHIGLTRRRRFFVQADDYTSVPEDARIDSTFPDMHELPRAIESIRNPTKRGRSVSVGPQSAADAYETLAYRAHWRGRSGTDAGRRAREERERQTRKEEADVLFQQVPESRVRYDVEVVTKLIVYTGEWVVWMMSRRIALLTRTGNRHCAAVEHVDTNPL
jgi:hypothetical protein